MPIEDFIEIFNELNLVRMYNTNLFALSRTWKTSYVKGTWEDGVTSGGDVTHTDTFLKNPQVSSMHLSLCDYFKENIRVIRMYSFFLVYV